MKRKKNRQYYKSRNRVLRYNKMNADAVCSAIRIATQSVISAVQIKIALSAPIPRYASGAIVSECGNEIVKGKLRDFVLPTGAKAHLNKKDVHTPHGKTVIDEHFDKLIKAMSKTTSIDDSEILKHYGG